jgi:hypothetical protein
MCLSPVDLLMQRKGSGHFLCVFEAEEYAFLVFPGSLFDLVLKQQIVLKLLLKIQFLDHGDRLDLQHQFLGELFGEVVDCVQPGPGLRGLHTLDAIGNLLVQQFP